MMRTWVLGASTLCFVSLFAATQAQPTGADTVATGTTTLTQDFLRPLSWRSIGPSVMVGRIVDIEAVASDPTTFFVATATGGLWKTVNSGVTFEALFQQEGSISLGDVAIAPSNPDIVWVGTGEHNARNSVSWGDGVYKSTDGGKSWTNMGLRNSYQIGRIAIHPKNPDIVLVGALGRLWGPNEERGLYRTTDGGKTWQRTLYVDDRTGVIDVQFDPKNPNNAIAATYERQRDLFDSIPNYDPSVKWSKNSALWKSTDGGKTWKRLEKGLPTVRMGRIGIDYFRKDPKLVFAIIETELVGCDAQQIEEALKAGPSNAQTYTGRREFAGAYQGQQPNRQDQQGPNGFQTGGIFKSTDGGETWTRINSLTERPFYYSQIRVDPSDPNLLYAPGLSLMSSSDGGKTFDNRITRGTHSDHHALWINPANSRHLIDGNDGGVYQSWDRGANWLHHNNIVASQIYHVDVDSREPYWVYAGFQDNGSWAGPSRKKNGQGNRNSDWFRFGGGDGFVCLVDREDPNVLYGESQDGNMFRINVRTGERANIRPPRAEGERLRFLWDTPMILSNHNTKIFYCAGNFVYRSLDRGNDLRKISPEISRTDRGSASALAESPRDAAVLWVGTDDGNLWVTRNGGVNWVNVAPNVPLPKPAYVSRIEPSRFADGRCYVAFDGHRSDFDGPLAFVTEDFGQTWTSINAGLPESGSTRVVREDVANPDVLYLGTEFGLFASIDRGKSWASIKNNLPTGAVHDLLVHPTEGELIVATHGRGIWIGDVVPIRQATTSVLEKPVHLFKPSRATQWGYAGPSFGDVGGALSLETDSVPTGVAIYYRLGAKAEKVSVRILTMDKQQVVEIAGSAEPGLNRVTWNLTRQRPGGGAPQEGGPRGGGGGGGQEGPQQQAQRVAPGTYLVVLEVDGKEFTETVEVRADPLRP